MRYAVLDLPLESIHKSAFAAARAAKCAQDQGKFWEMHDRLFAHSRQLEPLEPHAEAVGLDMDGFGACMQDDRSAAEIRKDMALAAKAGASGTPAFVIGFTDPDDPGKVEGLTFFKGARPFNSFRLELEKALKQEP